MAVSLTGLAAAGAAARGTSVTNVLTVLPELLRADADDAAHGDKRGERLAEEAEQRRRGATEAVASADAAATPAQTLTEAERRLDPTSRSFQRGAQRETQRAQFAAAQRQFRDALQDAAGARAQATNTAAPAGTGNSGPASAPGSPGAASVSSAPPISAPPAAPDGAPTGQGLVPAAPTGGAAEARPPESTAPTGLPASREAATVPAATPLPTSAGPPTTATGLNTTASGAPAPRPNEAVIAPSAWPGVASASAAPRPPGALGGGEAVRATAAARPAPAQRSASPSAEPRSLDHNVEQMLRVIRARVSEKHATALLRLDPPELGSLRMHLELRENDLTLRVETQSPLAQRMLSEQLDALRQGLSAAGLNLERIEIRAAEVAQAAGSPPEWTATDGSAGGQLPAFEDGGGRDDQPEVGGSGVPNDGERRRPADEPGAPPVVHATESRVNLWA